jgi:hypothetical protein
MTKILSNKSNIDLDYPICRPSLDLGFTQEELDPRITFSRGSIGTRVNRNRLIETVSANLPRFDYDPVTGECKGLLIEESRTNLLTYSEDFSQGVWTKHNSSINSNVITAPDNTSNATKLIENTSNVQHMVYRNLTSAVNTTYTFSFFAKSAERQYVLASFSGGGLSGDCVVGVSLIDGSVTTTSNSPENTSVTKLPNGWYRITLTKTTPSASAFQPRILISRTGSSSQTYQADGTSGVYIWGAQLEAGAFPTTYIPTIASTVTRSADNASMTGTNFSSWYNQSEGTLFVVASPSTNGAYSGFIYLLGTDFNNGITYLRQSDYQPVFRIRSGQRDEYSKAINGAVGFGQIWRNAVALKSAISFKTNDFNSFVSGVPITGSRATAGTLPTFTGPLYLGGLNAGSNSLNGTISRLTYYPRALKPNQLQYLTQ